MHVKAIYRKKTIRIIAGLRGTLLTIPAALTTYSVYPIGFQYIFFCI